MVPWSRTSTQTEEVQVDEPVIQASPCQPKEITTGKGETLKARNEPLNIESKESFRLQLGEYRGTVAPLSILFFGYSCGALAVATMKPDPRVEKWFLMDKSLPSLTICVLYILFSVVWGPNLMKNREKFKLRKVMIAYNAFQVVFSAFMFFEVGFGGWFFEYNYFCQPCDYTWTPKALRIARIGWLFYISKIVDFMDTLFFILNKKFSNVSMLHVVHHSCMCISMWYGIRYTPGGHITFMGYLNSGVHTLMYTYYFLTSFGPALRPYLWWKKYLTTIQLLQFVAIFLHAAQLFFNDCPDVPIGLAIWTCIYAFIFFTLFIDFYHRAYHGPRGNKLDSDYKKTSSSKEILSNESMKKDAWEGKNNGHIRSPSNLTFRIDSCLRERQPASN